MPVRVVISSTNIQVNSGNTVLLTAFGYGTPLPVISWLRDGGNLTNSSRIKIFESVVTRRGIPFAMSVLEICRVDHSDSRQYLISASNGITVDMARLEISVRGKHFYSMQLELDFCRRVIKETARNMTHHFSVQIQFKLWNLLETREFPVVIH